MLDPGNCFGVAPPPPIFSAGLPSFSSPDQPLEILIRAGTVDCQKVGLSENRLSPNPLVCQYFSMLNLLFGSIHHLQTHPNHTESESTECHAGFDVSSTGMFLPSNSPRRYVANLVSCCIHLLNRSNSNTPCLSQSRKIRKTQTEDGLVWSKPQLQLRQALTSS